MLPDLLTSTAAACSLQPPAAARQKDKFVPLSQPQQAAAAKAAAAADAAADAADGASSIQGGPWVPGGVVPPRGLTYAQRGGGVDAEAYSRCVVWGLGFIFKNCCQLLQLP